MEKRVLLVDTDSEINLANKKFLEGEGFQVTCTESAREALEVLNSVKPDLMVTEVMLENNDSGFTLCHRTKNKYPDLPIVILSDIVRKSGILFELNSNEEKTWIKADDFINKPVSPSGLASKIKKMLD